MIFTYKALSADGKPSEGTIDAFSVDVAIASLQKRGLILREIHSPGDKSKIGDWFMSLLNGVSNKDIVILSRQLATLFEAQVSALRIFDLLAGQVENPRLQKYLHQVSMDISGGASISQALSKFPDAFSPFYVNMVRAGEESGKLNDVFNYLADYLDRTYEVTSKAKNALIYPAFIITTFVAVMILMMTVIIPKIALMITDSGQPVPIYTQIVLDISNLFINYGIFMAVGLVIVIFLLWRYLKTDEGQKQFDLFRFSLPYLGNLYKKLYLSRIADNLNTMIVSGIPILRSLEITAAVVDNPTYSEILGQALSDVKSGSSLSAAFEKHKEIPAIMTQMIKVGEESGEVGNILKSLANFYRREVTNAVDTLVSLIEPVMIIALGLGVGILLSAVLIPIYNIAAAS